MFFEHCAGDNMDAKSDLIPIGLRGLIDPNMFRQMVAERAFFKAEKRGFAPGHEMDDWLEAEKEVSNQCFYWQQEV
jgi:hypothetical protein